MTGIARKWIPSLLLFLLLASGCSRRGSEFVGKWVSKTNPGDTMEIIRNGDQFLILSSGNKLGANYKDGALQLSGMMGVVTLTYIKSSDTVVAPGFFGQTEYKRAR